MLQILSVLAGCKKSASTCNVVSTGHREDAYTNIYKAMLEKLGEDSRIERDDLKKAIMTSLYGSKALPRKIFGEGELLEIFFETMKQETPGAWILNEVMLSCWNPETISHDWVMPDNFHVKTKVIGSIEETVHFLNKPYIVRSNVNMPQEEGRSLAANLTHSTEAMIIREVVRRCNHAGIDLEALWKLPRHGGKLTTRVKDKMLLTLLERYKASGFLSTRILQYLDHVNSGHMDYDLIMNMLRSFPKKSFKVITIHDMLKCHPNYVNDLREQFIIVMSDLAKANLMNDLLSQLKGYDIGVGPIEDLSEDIKNSEYIIC